MPNRHELENLIRGIDDELGDCRRDWKEADCIGDDEVSRLNILPATLAVTRSNPTRTNSCVVSTVVFFGGVRSLGICTAPRSGRRTGITKRVFYPFALQHLATSAAITAIPCTALQWRAMRIQSMIDPANAEGFRERTATNSTTVDPVVAGSSPVRVASSKVAPGKLLCLPGFFVCRCISHPHLPGEN
jgi:hypothetical protein